MSTGFDAGDAVHGEVLLYYRWGFPPNFRRPHKRYLGKLRVNGSVEIDEPLKVSDGVEEPEEQLECIRAHIAKFECDELHDQGKSTNPGHSGFYGELRGQAMAEITAPFKQK